MRHAAPALAACLSLALVAVLPASPGFAHAKKSFKGTLHGYEEVPSISTGASGEFRVKVSPDESMIDYTLSYEGLEGEVTQAHIHLAQPGVNGGIMVWLCGTASSPGPGGTPICPQEGGVSGVLTAASVIGPAGQGIAPGAFQDVLAAIRAGAAYANVHSTLYPGGEIRAQLR